MPRRLSPRWAQTIPLRLLERSGTAAKTGILLIAATRLRNEVIYLPVDVSPDALDAALGALLDNAGFTIEHTWTDPRQQYALRSRALGNRDS